jgi:hypothetical protein
LFHVKFLGSATAVLQLFVCAVVRSARAAG